MAFFRNMSFARWLIVLMLLTSSLLGWFVYTQSNRLDTVKRQLGPMGAPKIVREIQELGLDLNRRLELLAKEGLKNTDQPDFYIRRTAVKDRIEIGDVTVSPSTTYPDRGLKDEHYKIRPKNKTRAYARIHIANFLYQLEADSPRVRITNMKLTNIERVKPGEVGTDRWTFDATMTRRSPTDDS